MTAGVYAIISTTDGTVYVGSSVNIEARWGAHRHTFTGDGYEWSVLEVTEPTPDALEQAEQRWMDHYETHLGNTRRIARRPRPNLLYLELDGLKLQERRERLGLSTAELAREFRCTMTSLHRWETGATMSFLRRIGAEVVLKKLEAAQRKGK